MAANPSFGDFYAEPGTRVQKIAAQGSTIDRVHMALAYLETLYPGQIGEVCFIDRSGVENARVVAASGRSLGAVGRIQDCVLQAVVRATSG